ncbi:MAG: TlpA family protein disulfide reductase [Deltaproteobacteria bacterium]|nr:TlpA family protein disulfide reductase [Deltaproteobacteria bacterium]
MKTTTGFLRGFCLVSSLSALVAVSLPGCGGPAQQTTGTDSTAEGSGAAATGSTNPVFAGRTVDFVAPRLWSQWDPEPPGGKTTFDMKSVRGHVVIVHFWASWCEPCKRSMPYYDKLLKEHQDDPLDVVAVNMDDDHTMAVLFLENVPTSFVNVWDEGSKISRGLGIAQLPVSLLLDGDGVVQHSWQGEAEEDRKTFERELGAMLTKARPAIP